MANEQGDERKVRRFSDTKSHISIRTNRSRLSSSPEDYDLDLFNSGREESHKSPLPISNFVSLSHRLSKYSIYESLDCQECHNQLWHIQYNKIEKYEMYKEAVRWLIYIIIGICTALVNGILQLLLSYAFRLKNHIVLTMKTEFLMYLIHLSMDITFSAIAVILCLLEPAAIGSGYPQVKSYLNGIRLQNFFTFSALMAKLFGIFFSDIGGIICSKGECMIHIGACVASTIWESINYFKGTSVLKFFKNDFEKWNFILVGVTVGVVAGFGAPIGGMLVALESTASVWNQDNIWKNLVPAAVCTLVSNILMFHTIPNVKSILGHFDLAAFDILFYELKEIPIFILMGICGGVFGALFNAINIRVNLFRLRYLPKWWHKFLEVIFISGFTSTIQWLLLSNFIECRPIQEKYFNTPITIGCEEGQYNIAGSFYIKQPGETHKWLLLAPYGEIPVFLLGVTGIVKFILLSITLGIYQSVGIIYSILVVGSSYGRIIGEYLRGYTTGKHDEIGKYALIGGAAFLGGIIRSPLSITVILLEASDIQTTYIFALVATLQTAQLVGDIFNDDLYERFARNTPMLSVDSPPFLFNIKAYDIMNYPVLCFKLREDVSYINAVMNSCEHNAFPVVNSDEGDDRTTGRLVGLILRSQIMVILIRGYFKERERKWINTVSIDEFRDYQRTHPIMKAVHINPEIHKRNYTVDFTVFMNPAPIRVSVEQSAISIFRIFRGLSLRHIVVIDDNNKVIGIITRKDFSNRL